MKHGNSWVVTIPRPMMLHLEFRPGDFVELADTPEKELVIRAWDSHVDRGKQSPGIVPSDPPVVPR